MKIEHFKGYLVNNVVIFTEQNFLDILNNL